MKQLDTQRDIAIAHWGEHCNGGAERVAWELQRLFDSPLYVGDRDPSIEPDDVDDVHGLFEGRITSWAIRRGGFPRAASYFLNWSVTPSAGKAVSTLKKHDTIVTSGNETLFYCGPDTQTQVHYVHHTSRRHTDLLDAWPNTWRGTVGRAYAFVIRQLLNNPTSRPDLFVCNSEVIARRVHKYWGVPKDEIRVVYPPVPTHTFSGTREETEDIYVTLGRLDNWHKHIDELIRAFNGTDRRLLIAGTGPDESHLKRIAEDNVEFLGYVDEDEKRSLLSRARAFVFGGEQEDFGIAPAESLASGTPVIGPEEGFTQHQIRPGKAGLTFDRDELHSTLEEFERDGVEWSPAQIERHAEHFGIEAFHEGMKSVVAEAEERATVTVEWDDDGVAIDPPQTHAAITDGGAE